MNHKNLTHDLITCLHCGNIANMKLDISAERETSIYDAPNSPIAIERYEVMICPNCNKELVRRYSFRDDIESEDIEGYISYEEYLYPENSRLVKGLPSDLHRQYQAALRIRFIDPTACMILQRRLLEAICEDQGIVPHEVDANGNPKKKNGKTVFKPLNNKIIELRDAGIIPDNMLDIALNIKDFGNEAVHEIHDTDLDELSTVIDLMQALLIYLYQMPFLLNRAQKHISNRSV